MIYVLDDFIEKPLMITVDKYINDGPFEKHISGEKDFYID